MDYFRNILKIKVDLDLCVINNDTHGFYIFKYKFQLSKDELANNYIHKTQRFASMTALWLSYYLYKYK